MKHELNSINLVVLFTESGKHMININELTNLFPGETPSLFWPPDPISPGIIEYRNSGFGVSIVDNRLQIQSKAIKGNIPSYFSNNLERVLQAAKERSIIAYGFNFDYACSEVKEVVRIFNITIKPNSFTYIPNTSLKLTFEKNGVLFTFSLTDGHPFSLLHINVHHEEATKADTLAKNIAEKLKVDFESASMLINEVFVCDEKGA